VVWVRWQAGWWWWVIMAATFNFTSATEAIGPLSAP
jgi:hypothetical protein